MVRAARELAPRSQESESLLHLAVSSSSAITISSSFTEADTGARDIGDLFPRLLLMRIKVY